LLDLESLEDRTLMASGLMGGSLCTVRDALHVGSSSVAVTAINNFVEAANGSQTYHLPTLEVVKSTSTTTVVSALNPSIVGQAVSFTATVSNSSGSGSPIPTGTVTFLDGATTTFGTADLSAGSATISTAILSGGAHTITVLYSGDANFTGSTSAAITQLVSGRFQFQKL
jgi:hypothetical protein